MRLVKVRVWPLARGVLLEGQEIIERFFGALTTPNEGMTVELR